MYVYVCISVPVNPRHLDCAIARLSAGAYDNKTLYLATIGHETAQHSTSLLHTAFRLLLTPPNYCSNEGYTPLGNFAILADVTCSPWPGALSLAFTVHLGEAITRTVLAQHGRTGFPAQLQICRCRLPSCHPVLHLACYPFFLTASESRLHAVLLPKVYLPWPSYAHPLYITEITGYILSSEAGCILMYAQVYTELQFSHCSIQLSPTNYLPSNVNNNTPICAVRDNCSNVNILAIMLTQLLLILHMNTCAVLHV